MALKKSSVRAARGEGQMMRVFCALLLLPGWCVVFCAARFRKEEEEEREYYF